LHRSDDGGRTFGEIAMPAFPADAADAPALFQILTIEGGGRAHPDRLWIGAIPAGLFRSDDCGDSWQLAAALWNVPERTHWFGGGYDAAGIRPIHATMTARSWRFPAGACGKRAMPAPAGLCGALWISDNGGECWS
jgi:hypothetical protein